MQRLGANVLLAPNTPGLLSGLLLGQQCLGGKVCSCSSIGEQAGASRSGWSYLRELISRTRLSQEMFSSLPRCSVPRTSFWKTERKEQTQGSGMLCFKALVLTLHQSLSGRN